MIINIPKFSANNTDELGYKSQRRLAVSLGAATTSNLNAKNFFADSAKRSDLKFLYFLNSSGFVITSL